MLKALRVTADKVPPSLHILQSAWLVACFARGSIQPEAPFVIPLSSPGGAVAPASAATAAGAPGTTATAAPVTGPAAAAPDATATAAVPVAAPAAAPAAQKRARTVKARAPCQFGGACYRCVRLSITRAPDQLARVF